MSPKLRKLLDNQLCELVSRETGLKVVYNEKDQTIKINDKPAIKLDEKERRRLVALIGA